MDIPSFAYRPSTTGDASFTTDTQALLDRQAASDRLHILSGFDPYTGLNSHRSSTMKSAAFVSSLLASAALAQPHGHGHGHHRRHSHGHHAKRGLVTDWVTETVYETVTVIVDDSTTETIMPSSEHVQAQPSSSSVTTTTTALPGQFFENPKPSTAAPTTTSQPVAPPYVPCFFI